MQCLFVDAQQITVLGICCSRSIQIIGLKSYLFQSFFFVKLGINQYFRQIGNTRVPLRQIDNTRVPL